MKIAAVLTTTALMLLSADAPGDIDPEGAVARACADVDATRTVSLDKGETRVIANSGSSYGTTKCDRFVLDVKVTSKSIADPDEPEVGFIIKRPAAPPYLFECALATGVADIYLKEVGWSTFLYAGRLTLQGRITADGCVMEWDRTGTYTGPFSLPEPGKTDIYRIAASYEIADKEPVHVGIGHVASGLPVPTGPAPLP